MGKIDERLQELRIDLPRPPKAVANYVSGVVVGEVLCVAGTIGTTVDENEMIVQVEPGG